MAGLSRNVTSGPSLAAIRESRSRSCGRGARGNGRRGAGPPSLYYRLGGLYPVSAVVDDFIDGVHANATLNANPAIGKGRNAMRKPGLKVHVATLVCQVTGRPCIVADEDGVAVVPQERAKEVLRRRRRSTTAIGGCSRSSGGTSRSRRRSSYSSASDRPPLCVVGAWSIRYSR